MLFVFRIICAVAVAWAMSWAMTRPEAAALVEEIPDFATLAPIAGAIVGFFNLAKRQGWGMIVSVANGLWAGALSLILAAAIIVFVAVREAAVVSVNLDFDFLMKLMSEETAQVAEQLFFLPLIVIAMGATAVVGVITEIIHWAMVRLRKRKHPDQSSEVH